MACQPPSPTVLGAMMLSFACRSLSRHGELILKGSGPRTRRGAAAEARRRGGPAWRSVLEDTALSWVTSWSLQRAGRGEAEAARWPSVDSGVFREQMGDVWSHLRWVEEYEAARGSSTSEEGGGGEALQWWCCCRESEKTSTRYSTKSFNIKSDSFNSFTEFRQNVFTPLVLQLGDKLRHRPEAREKNPSASCQHFKLSDNRIRRAKNKIRLINHNQEEFSVTGCSFGISTKCLKLKFCVQTFCPIRESTGSPDRQQTHVESVVTSLCDWMNEAAVWGG